MAYEASDLDPFVDDDTRLRHGDAALVDALILSRDPADLRAVLDHLRDLPPGATARRAIAALLRSPESATRKHALAHLIRWPLSGVEDVLVDHAGAAAAEGADEAVLLGFAASRSGVGGQLLRRVEAQAARLDRRWWLFGRARRLRHGLALVAAGVLLHRRTLSSAATERARLESREIAARWRLTRPSSTPPPR